LPISLPTLQRTEPGWGHTQQDTLLTGSFVDVREGIDLLVVGANANELVEHLISVGDELEIKFPHRPLFSEKVMVREDGMI